MPPVDTSATVAPIVDIRALRKSYGSNEVLKGIDLQIAARRGDRHHRQKRLGQKHAAALHQRAGRVPERRADRGQQTAAAQRDAAAMRALRQRVGMIFQGFNLFPHLTVGKNIMLAPSSGQGQRRASR